MTDNEIFQKLFEGGNYTLPYLIKFSCSSKYLYFVNSNQNVTYDGHTYSASTFEYTPPNNYGEGGTLRITGIDNTLVEFIEAADYRIRIDVVGLLIEGTTVQKLRQYQHCFGSVSFSENMEIEFTLGRDDRLDMQFCPYKFDTDNNRSNA